MDLKLQSLLYASLVVELVQCALWGLGLGGALGLLHSGLLSAQVQAGWDIKALLLS